MNFDPPKISEEREKKDLNNKKPSNWQQLESEKKFALITLVSLGSALLITGRTARALTKRIPKFTGQPIEATQNSSLVSQTLENVIPSRSHPLSDPHLVHSPSQLNDHQLKSIRNLNVQPLLPKKLGPTTTTTTTTAPQKSFWDNKSITCIKKNDEYEKVKELNFNPILDATLALSISTCIVISSTYLMIKKLGQKWELENWQDWKLFIQGGHLNHLIISSSWNHFFSNLIPQTLKISSIETLKNQEQEEEEEEEKLEGINFFLSKNLWEWKNKLDDEWSQELLRREIERKEWVKKRHLTGKRIW
ncbi:hypothetical protein CROQUDRAFT_45952 [Cronartium quercuum f. sp. fusiforme G11]|uniref:Uncharacterized protein n=1 Tax=Cronartium quercuum f. sp. fusiforme G11 TaxID=708437 RepID=A0A9P6NEH3_9BASI|nr:hypothetical protein CROQUDRAFT_45952 [Cronartium quercuum f. sp. fusiforme G11]